MSITYGSVCSGIEAATTAWEPLGWRPKFFSEIEKFPSAVLAHHYGSNMPGEPLAKNGVPNYGDFTQIGADAGPVDLLVGGTPCFSSDTLIVTKRGLLPICEVVVGDYVFTHMNRWRKVLAVGSKVSHTIRLKGQGQSHGIVTTSGHPFYSREKSRVWVGRENGSYAMEMSLPEWIKAGDMQGRFWASPTSWPVSKPPVFEMRGREHPPPPMTSDLAWIIGRWVGDGWTRINHRRGYALICCGNHEADILEKRLHNAGLKFSRLQERTTTRFQIANRALARWLHVNFGSGAATKTMPIWLFGWELRQDFLIGYISADGCKTGNGWRISTVSEKLALGVTLLAHSLGKSVTRFLAKTRRSEVAIEGRECREKPFWQITIYESSRSSIEDGRHRWGLVRTVEEGEVCEVWNIEVDGDNSYIADGVAVHNCQAFSIAGKRLGLDDPRGNLALEFLALAQRLRARWIVWENVPGVLSANGGRDFGAFLELVGQCGYGFAYRVLDTQHVRTQRFPRAIPQRRRRVILVGYLGDWRRAAAVLLEPESLRGDPAPRREAGQGVAGTVSARTQGGGGLGTDFKLGGGLVAADAASCLNASFGDKLWLENQHINQGAPLFVAHTLRGEGHDESEDGTGRGTPVVPVSNPLTAGMSASGSRMPHEQGALIPIAFSSKDYGADAEINISPTLRAGGHDKSHANAGNPPAVAFDMRGREGGAMPEGPHDTANIRAASGGSSRSYVAFAQNQRDELRQMDAAGGAGRRTGHEAANLSRYRLGGPSFDAHGMCSPPGISR